MINGHFGPADDNETCTHLIDFAVSAGDDPSDEAWLPPKEARRAAQQKQPSAGWPKQYKKGPDVGSKSARTHNASDASAGINKFNGPTNLNPGLAREAKEAWEDELEEQEQGGIEVRGWNELREQIKSDLSKGAKTLPLSCINQLLLIRNFATLRLKGSGRIEASLEIARQWHEGKGAHFAWKVRALACHYQVFEQLPVKKCGGRANDLSPLKDEQLQLASRQWLTSQAVGQITPSQSRFALNDTILPSLNITLAWPLLRKGVYMDGHECDDVKKYRQEVFLPAMAAFESCMIHYEGLELHCVEPNLLPGEKVIANWHDKCCFHGNDFKTHAYKGRIIHVLGFINSEDGRLALRNKDGDVIEEAREIIYPGANGDAWWDTEQLLDQVKWAIWIFEAAHPNCISLFIFYQSSAHALLPPDALKAFKMNKSNGGKQWKQQDTIIPQSNPTVEQRGSVQKMTLPDGRPKGLQQYWGWCKYRYREVQKKTFAEAKHAAQEQLNACPTDVI
ncbi:hypothetical protein PAXRUDRAFT_36084 [Paxillus rubicundulus Ve08.2h10]|uniref:Uncharacterized protein n=1 Tax=Paxillus rubicundulus Ve08.2h10 TaxID=930991 RepID=A0A0D0DH90_9AGAM|nr:hypothetical protein PAXRUDRAFT_36084 [Paxillus rubicundulus Ve08.2h10]